VKYSPVWGRESWPGQKQVWEHLTHQQHGQFGSSAWQHPLALTHLTD